MRVCDLSARRVILPAMHSRSSPFFGLGVRFGQGSPALRAGREWNLVYVPWHTAIEVVSKPEGAVVDARCATPSGTLSASTFRGPPAAGSRGRRRTSSRSRPRTRSRFPAAAGSAPTARLAAQQKTRKECMGPGSTEQSWSGKWSLKQEGSSLQLRQGKPDVDRSRSWDVCVRRTQCGSPTACRATASADAAMTDGACFRNRSPSCRVSSMRYCAGQTRSRASN